MSETTFAAFEGENGAKVEIFDRSTQYAYKNIYYVRLKVEGRFPGREEVFERTLEKMGVFEEDLDSARAELVGSFRKTVLPYLMREDFGGRLAEARKKERPKATGYGTIK